MKVRKTPTSPLRGLEDRPGFLIRRAHQISQAVFIEECAGLDITSTQFGVLWVLGRGEQLDQITIARLLGFDRSTTSMVVKLLEDRKLVVRSPDKEDRRRYLLRLTKAGEDLRRRAETPVDRVRQRLESVFAPAEAKTFSRLLEKFTRAMA
jgi:DNA-binding MarR family transcriptional regulator